MSALTSTCRSLIELNGLAKAMLDLAITDIISQGVNPLVVETYRSQERQNYLYCQGRTITECTSKGISTSFASAFCNTKAKKVTWTLNSVHKSRKAVDIVPQRIVNGKMTAIWDAKDRETKIIIATMKKYGFEAGADWKSSPDSPHFQVKGDYANIFTQEHNNYFVTLAIQKALNRKLKLKLVEDGKWGQKTTDAVIEFRRSKNYKQLTGMLGAAALTELLK